MTAPRPHQRFTDANSARMSVRLETACIREEREAASWLPPEAWVSLNVSPSLATAVVPLVAALERTEREVVLEITEHVEIGDYRTLPAALDLLRDGVGWRLTTRALGMPGCATSWSCARIS